MYLVAAFAILARFIILVIVYTLRSVRTETNFSFFDLLLELSNRWDGNSYIFIAKNWYASQGPNEGFIVFPPFYPILVRALTDLIPSFNVSALIVANIFFLLSVLTFYKLLRLDFNPLLSKRIVALFILFPTAYFFNVSYPESLFVFLLLASFYFVRQQNYLLGGTYAAMATLTRPFSLAIWPALLVEWLILKNRKLRDLFILVIFGAISTAIYLGINYQVFGDYFAFQNMLSIYWQKRFGIFTQNIYSSWKIGLLRVENDYYKYLVGYGEAFSSSLAWIIIGWAAIRKKTIRPSYLVYCLIAIFMATSTTFILSVPRYYLSVPFLFIVLGKALKYRFLFYLIIAIFVLMNILLLFRFSRGEWAF